MAEKMPPPIPAGVFLDDNRERRCPVVLLADTSASMQGRPMEVVNRCLKVFQEDMRKDAFASRCVELAVITFGGSPRVIQDWSDIEHCVVPTLPPNGNTLLGPAMQMAVDMIESRRALYRQNGIVSFVPWLFILTGGALDEGPELIGAIDRVKKLQQVAPGSRCPKLHVLVLCTDTHPEVMGRLHVVTNRVYKLEESAYRDTLGDPEFVSDTFVSNVPIQLPETPKGMVL